MPHKAVDAKRMDDRVRKYLRGLDQPQRRICERLRDLILQTCPEIEESFKNGVPWYECRYYIVSFRDHVNLGFCMEGLTEQQMSQFEGNGRYMRHIKVRSLAGIDERRMISLINMVKNAQLDSRSP